MAKKKTDYGLAVQSATRAMKAPELPYRPRDPKKYRPAIALIACGGITEQHLKAYKAAAYNVVALCDADRAKAEAEMTTDQADFLRKADGNEAKALGLLVLETAKDMAQTLRIDKSFVLKQLLAYAPRQGRKRFLGIKNLHPDSRAAMQQKFTGEVAALRSELRALTKEEASPREGT